MKYKQKLKLVNEILKNSQYKIQKKKILELFNKTKDNDRSDILLRLYLIDSCYSTNMNRRYFGFEQLVDNIFKIKSEIKKDINVENFINKNFDLMMKPVGIDKKGKKKGHAFSLFTKYIYFASSFNFPIYDRLVYDGMVRESILLTKTHRPSKNYFMKIIEVTKNRKTNFNDLDKYFWVCGKIKEGNLSLIIKDEAEYIDNFLKELKLTKSEEVLKSDDFNRMISNKLILNSVKHDYEKLKKIKKLAILSI